MLLLRAVSTLNKDGLATTLQSLHPSEKTMGTVLNDEKVERSRRYPSANVRDAVAMLEQVHTGLGLSGGARESIARALGHATLNGSSKRKIAVLLQYGLLDRDGERYRISELGRRLIIPLSENERIQAFAEAVRRPPLFQTLGSIYDQQPIPSMLPNVLAREHGVLPQASTDVAAIFVQSAEQAGLLSDGILNWTGEPRFGGSADQPAPTSSIPEQADQVEQTARAFQSSATTRADTQDYSIPLDNRGRTAVIRMSTPVLSRDLDRLAAWLKYMRDVVVDEPPDVSAN